MSWSKIEEGSNTDSYSEESSGKGNITYLFGEGDMLQRILPKQLRLVIVLERGWNTLILIRYRDYTKYMQPTCKVNTIGKS